MCIHIHHCDIHLDHVSYSMGGFRAMDIFISLLIYDHFSHFYYVRSFLDLLDVYDPTLNFC